MPVYEYRCIENDHQFDLSQPIGAAPPACPICGSPTRKVYGSVGIIFKGSGFHVTDYRRPASGDGKAPEKPAAKTTAETGSAAPGGGEAGTNPPKKS